jgi:hypothetical protein
MPPEWGVAENVPLASGDNFPVTLSTEYARMSPEL